MTISLTIRLALEENGRGMNGYGTFSELYPLSYQDLHPERDSNPRPPLCQEVSVACATGRGG